MVAMGMAAANASPIDVQKARRIAANCLKMNGVSQVELTDITSSMPYSEFYTFVGSNGKGFVLVSGDDCVVPILGYSATETFSVKGMPSNIRGWLEDCEAQIRFYKNLPANRITTDHSAEEAALRNQWERLDRGMRAEQPLLTAVAPLLSTRWNQSPYYNNLCPYDSYYAERTVTGCVATATAQIMKYWNHPTTGYGSHSYTHSTYGTQSANFGTTTYAWASMPDSLISSTPSAQKTAVATLMYHVGVAVEMNYNVSSEGGSGANNNNETSGSIAYFGSATVSCAENALRYYFKYRSDMHHVNYEDFTQAQWLTMLRNELDNNRPVLYSGHDNSGGHSFVCDGYNNSGLFHFNWGWGGYCDGYYAIGSLNPSSGGTGGNTTSTFNLENAMVIGIQPNSSFGGSTSVSATTASGGTGTGTVTGGGSYTGTTTNLVTLSANAAPGSAFTGWADGFKYNPRTLYANGGSYSFQANFKALGGDTLGYCADRNLGAYQGYSSPTVWGIRIPASCLTAGHDLTKVMMYINTAGSYTLNVYTGTTSASTLALTQNFTAPSSLEGHWAILTLSSPVAVSGSQSLWIMLQSSADYPAAVTYYAGNDDSRIWGSTSGTFTNAFSFMVKGVFAASSTPVTYGDTVSYCDTASYVTSVGAGGNLDWGIKMPPSMVSHRSYVTDVMLYVPSAGSYTLNVYRGASTTTSTLMATQVVTYGSGDANSWQTIHLTSPVATSSTQPLWVTFHNSGVAYPAASCAYVADSNSSLISLDGGSSWISLTTASGGSLSYSWLIKVILSNSATPPVSIQGPTSVGAGVVATYAAVGPTSGSYSWSFPGGTPSTATGATASTRWNTPGTYNVMLTCSYGGTLLRDTLAVTVTACGVTSFPFTMGFEASESVNCWNHVDNDNDGYGWQHASQAFNGVVAHSGSDCYASASYINNVGALTPDNWLVTPCLHLTAGNNYTLTWYDGAVDSSYYAEHYSVYVSTTGNSVSDFTSSPVFSTTLTTVSHTQRTVSLNAYAGQDIYIAFRHHNSNDVYWLLIDDISVTETTATTNYTITVLSDNPAMGTVSGGGTFASGTVTTITATANSGYHFVQWNDGNTNAVRSITVTANATYTAYFAANTTPPAYGDTVSYCDTASYVTSVGAGGNLDWGIKMPPSMVSHRSYVTDVMLYVPSAGSYTLNVYRGASTTTSTLMATQVVTYGSGDANSWQTIHLTSPVATSSTQPLWVTFHNSGVAYPAASCAYVADSNSSLISLDGGSSWISLTTASGGSLSYSWLIKVILSNSATPPVSIQGPTSVGAGVVATYAAVGPTSGSYSWSFPGGTPSTATGATASTRWNTPGTYNVMLTCSYGGTLLRDTLAVTVTACGVTSFPFTMGFEASESVNCWNHVDNDNDGYGWQHASQAFNGVVAHSGSDCYASASYINNVGALTPDNWLVTPCLHLTAGNNYTLTWYDGAVDSSYYAEHYSVYVSTTGNSVSDFTSSPVFSTTLTTVSHTQRTVSLNAYAGQDIYIAFRHHNSNDVYWLLIDDISVTETTATTNYTITVLSDNPAMGTVSGGGTFASGTVTTITATANSGYHFVQWNDGNTNAVRSITVTANATYTAYFAANAPDTYTITVLPNDPLMGSVTGSGTFASGTVTTITATANSGYHFVQWNDGNTDAIRTITVTADAVYTAYFAADEVQYFTITVQAADNAMGTVEGGGTFPQGTSTVIKAIAYAGYQFSHWNDAAVENPRTIIVTSDATYVANFVAMQGIDDSQAATFQAVPLPGFAIALSGVANKTVGIYDIMGRLLVSRHCEQEQQTLQLPSAGVYMIVVDDLPAQRVVLVR